METLKAGTSARMPASGRIDFRRIAVKTGPDYSPKANNVLVDRFALNQGRIEPVGDLDPWAHLQRFSDLLRPHVCLSSQPLQFVQHFIVNESAGRFLLAALDQKTRNHASTGGAFSAGAAARGAREGQPSFSPHSEQKRAPDEISAEHLGQLDFVESLTPHCGQNFAPSVSTPHSGQTN